MPALRAQVNVLTWHNDNLRTGQNLSETTLTPANVSFSTFGRLFTLSVDGKVDAQPLYVTGAIGSHNVLYVATEHDSVYAFDADTGAQLWQVSLLQGGETPSDGRGCGQVVPEIGITSTPAIDLGTGAIYVVAMSKAGSVYHHRVHALDLKTGSELFGGPVDVQATYPGHGAGSSGGAVTFDPKQYKERSALLIQNGILYTSWGSHCDIPPYTGWVIAYNDTTLARTAVLNLIPNGSDGAMWNAGSGPAADAGGNVYAMTGNGTFDPTLNSGGFPVNNDYGNAIVKITPSGSTLTVADYFTMDNTVSESNGDTDLGSGGFMLIPPAATGSVSLGVGAGKDGNIYVVDTNNAGKFNPGINAVYQELPGALSSVFSSPAWFNGRLYYGSVGSTLKAFDFASGSFGSSPSSHTANSFGYPGTTPAISANGTANGIVWAAENSGPAVLHAYNAADLSKELYNSNQAPNSRDQFGSGNKFIVPTVANGKVYVGTENGVGVFGLLCANTLSAPSANVSASGGPVTIGVIPAGSPCSWTAASSAPWITIASGASGSGAGNVNITVSPNSGMAHVGTLTIAGQTFTVLQAGASLFSAITSPSPGSVLPDTTVTFVWTLAPGVDAYKLEIGNSQGLGDIYAVVTTAGSQPVGGLPCDGRPVFVQLSIELSGVWQTPVQYTYHAMTGCASTVTFNSAGATVGSGGGTGTVGITTSASNVGWNVASTVGWITITSGSSGTGNGAISYSVAANPSGTQRIGTITLFSSAFTITQSGTSTSSGARFVPVAPCRVADTRNPAGPFGAPAIAGNGTRTFAIPQSSCGIPATAVAYSLNVTVVPEGPLSFLTIWPAGAIQPLASTLNSQDGRIVANAAIVPAGSNGGVSVFATDLTDVVIDINGYFDAQSQAALFFYPVTPCRAADTRNVGGPIAGGQSRHFALPQSPCAVSGGAYALNVTAVPQSGLSYLTAWPTGQTQPFVSTLNSLDGSVVANAAIVPAGTNGSVDVFATNTTDVVLDVNGFFGSSAMGATPLSFYPVTPCRVADTRNAAGTFGGPRMGAAASRDFPIPASACGIPATAKAYSLNVTVVPQAGLSFLTLWPAGSTQPVVSTLNSPAGRVLANAAIVPAGTNGSVSVFVTDPTDVVLDINGYFAP